MGGIPGLTEVIWPTRANAVPGLLRVELDVAAPQVRGRKHVDAHPLAVALHSPD
jgi:hypothetical protein